MSVPTAAPADGQAGSPIGFILSRDRLITLRYVSLRSFDDVIRGLDGGESAPTCSLEIFVALCEAIVDQVADALETLAGDLDPLSAAAFHVDDLKGRRAVRSNRILRGQLRSLGRHGDRLAHLRNALVGLARVVAFAEQNTKGWMEAAIAPRLVSLTQDIASLNDYDTQMFERVQFLLDALVGLISIAQNDIFKVLTIVSIVGIPPTLVASIYGMNFRNMPEYSWAWGYQYGLAMIVLSAVIPILWFKFKGWF